MSKGFLLEIAVESVTAAQAAERAGADRIELCADLRNGGVTPSTEMMREARSTLNVPIMAMIRPRAGNFVYSAEEFEEMRSFIALARETGANGVVLGILHGDSTVDVARTKELVELASPLAVTFHRAFDECKDQFAAMENVILTGATRILTSGGAPTVPGGLQELRELVKAAGERITILPGGGLKPENFVEARRVTGAREFHTGLGTVMPYGSTDTRRFEEEIAKIVAEKKRES